MNSNACPWSAFVANFFCCRRLTWMTKTNLCFTGFSLQALEYPASFGIIHFKRWYQTTRIQRRLALTTTRRPAKIRPVIIHYRIAPLWSYSIFYGHHRLIRFLEVHQLEFDCSKLIRIQAFLGWVSRLTLSAVDLNSLDRIRTQGWYNICCLNEECLSDRYSSRRFLFMPFINATVFFASMVEVLGKSLLFINNVGYSSYTCHCFIQRLNVLVTWIFDPRT